MNTAGTDAPQPLLAHLVELRRRLLHSLLAVLVLTLTLLPFANRLYDLASAPLRRWLPEGSRMIATEVSAPFMVPLKLAIVSAVCLAIPFLLWQLWAFVAPGLYRREKRFVLPLMAASVLLFHAGVAFAYTVVCPLVFGFFSQAGPASVAVMTDMSRYLDFLLTLLLAFGMAFQIPVAILLAIHTGLASAAGLAARRPYVVLGCFVAGMLLTPPDIFSQTLLALPMWLLFEAGLLLGRWLPAPPPPDAD